MGVKQVLILGSGALATLFAARLSAAGADVRLLGSWSEALDAFNERGAQVEGESPFHVHAYPDTTGLHAVPLALVLVKAWQTERAARQLSDCLAKDGLAVSLQNGLGNTELLGQTLGQNRVRMGITTLGATVTAPGIVRLAGMGPVWLEDHPRLRPLVEILRAGGFQVELEKDIQPRGWGKLVINAGINPLTAILRVKNIELLNDPRARTLMGILVREAAQVAEAQGILLPFSDPVAAAEEVAEQTGENISSMLRDVQRGAPSEVAAINGTVVRLGEERGLDVAVNRLVCQLVENQTRLSSVELSDMVRLK